MPEAAAQLVRIGTNCVSISLLQPINMHWQHAVALPLAFLIAKS
jgi:hypothetical protein